MLINQTNLVQKTRGLGETGYTLFMLSIERANFENVVYLRPKDISDSIGMDQSQVCKGIKRLISKGILIPLEDYQHYQISPDILWKGKPRTHVKAIESLNQ